MKTIEHQMWVADEILHTLETFDPTCILAGGAPRDWYFSELATDLDFFVYWRPDFENQKWRYKEQLEKLGLDFLVRLGVSIEDFPPNYKRNPHLLCVFGGEYKGELIQVMFMKEKTFRSVVPLFPFGICQAWYKYPYEEGRYSSGIQLSQEFEKSAKTKTLKLLNDLYNDADGYVAKIRSKFPDYKYIGK